MALSYINGNFYEDFDAKISIKDRGFRFGDSLFETVSFYNKKLFCWELHLKRLELGLKSLKIIFNTEQLESLAYKIINANKIDNGFIRICITRGEGSRGYLPTNAKPPSIIIECNERLPIATEFANLYISDIKKIPVECLPVNQKLSQGLNSTLAKIEASENNCFEALQLTVEGYISECSSANIFWIKDNNLFTPSLNCSALNGTIRQYLINNLNKTSLTLNEGKFTLEDLKTADEVFITNVSVVIMPVKSIQKQGFIQNYNSYNKSQFIKKTLFSEIADFIN
jgi:aminodeoxychorismate lyase